MRLTILSALAVMALRFFLFKSGRSPEGTDLLLVHFLAIVTVVFFAGHRMLQQDPQSGFPDLLREGFRNGAVYSLLLGIYLWSHYSFIESAHFTQRIDDLVARGVAEGQPEALIRGRMEKFFTPFNYATISFFALMAVTTVQTLLIGLLHHKVLRRFMQ